MTRMLLNLGGFQLGWFIAVVGAAQGHPYLGPAYALAAVWLHLRFISTDRAGESMLIAAAVAIGFCLDSSLVLVGVMSFPPHAQLGAPTTFWMLSLWVLFAATLRHSLGWMANRYVLGAVLGAVFGPGAYWAGERLGAMDLGPGESSLLWIALEWSVAMPLLLLIAARRRPALGRAA